MQARVHSFRKWEQSFLYNPRIYRKHWNTRPKLFRIEKLLDLTYLSSIFTHWIRRIVVHVKQDRSLKERNHLTLRFCSIFEYLERNILSKSGYLFDFQASKQKQQRNLWKPDELNLPMIWWNDKISPIYKILVIIKMGNKPEKPKTGPFDLSTLHK